MEKEYIEIKKIVSEVQTYVEKNHHAFVLPEHLLYILLDDSKVSAFLKRLKFNKKEVKENLEHFFEDIEKVKDVSKIVATTSYTQVIQKAIVLADMRACSPDTLHIFHALYNSEETFARYYLLKQGLKEEDIIDYIQSRSTIKTTHLEKYATNLVDMARMGCINKIGGRNKEVERMIQILNKKKSNNVILTSMPGVGKSAVVEGLAKRICDGDVPEAIKGYDVWAIDLSSMISGTKFRGEFEERLNNVIKEISTNPKCFTFIDEIHTVVGAGSGAEGSLDASNILKPYLSRGELRLIGATTYDEYKNRILKDKAFSRRFKKIDLKEPNYDETLEILEGIKGEYEEYHGVKYDTEILKLIIELSGRYVVDKFYPDKAIDVLDEVGSQYRSGIKFGEFVKKEDVEDVICRMANIKEITSSVGEKDKVKNLSENIKKELFGQEETVDKIVRKVKMAKAGLANKGKPLVVSLLLGKTGTGKTEFAKQLAKNLDMNFVKLDMSEYSLEMDVNKLTGCAQGFVGYEQSGALTEPIIQNPNTVLLLDEIEKAHKNVYNLLLQMMDEGKLTDNNGREANYKNSIVIMTSNVGVAQAEETSDVAGFIRSVEEKEKDKLEVMEKVMKKYFSPEFRNRIQEICVFNDLNEKSLRMIVDKNVRRINNDLKEKNIEIVLTDNAIDKIVEESAKEKMGGRPVERLVNKHISEKIVDEILYGKLESGGKVIVDFEKDEEFIYNYS